MELPELDEIALPSLDDSTAEQVTPDPVKNAERLPSGTRVTEGNAVYLKLAGTFPGADSEAFSVLANRQESRLHSGGVLPTVKGTEKRLRKLERMYVLDRYTSRATGTNHFGVTKAGVGAAWSFGHNIEDAPKINNLAINRLPHYQMIAHVAAQFASPAGFFRESLGIGPVPLESLVSEHQMRAAYDPTKRLLEERRKAKKGASDDYGRWRSAHLEAARTSVQERIEAATSDAERDYLTKLLWSSFVEANPVLLTLGMPAQAGSTSKTVYQPDLAVMLDRGRSTRAARNLLVEVELSKKSFKDYDAILSTMKAELDQPYVYARAVYFTVGQQIPNLIRKVDELGKYKLIESGKLTILPLQHRDGTPVSFERRVKVGGR